MDYDLYILDAKMFVCLQVFYGPETSESTMQQRENPNGLSSPVLAISIASLSVLLAYFLVASRAGALLDSRSSPRLNILSNGTHPFQRTVVLVSFDGFRYAYLAL